MSRKWLLILFLIGVICLGSATLIWAITPSPAAAQCGSNPPPDSTCYTCHILEDPVAGNGEWHGVHARKDCCARCHGGNCTAAYKDLAHQDMIANPLSDIYTNCHSCHPDDYQARAVTFAVELGITPGSIATPTLSPAGKVAASPLVILPSPISSQPPAFPWPALLGGVTIMVLILLGLIAYITHLRA